MRYGLSCSGVAGRSTTDDNSSKSQVVDTPKLTKLGVSTKKLGAGGELFCTQDAHLTATLNTKLRVMVVHITRQIKAQMRAQKLQEISVSSTELPTSYKQRTRNYRRVMHRLIHKLVWANAGGFPSVWRGLSTRECRVLPLELA